MKSFKIVDEFAIVKNREITVRFTLVCKATGEIVEAKGVAKCSPEDKFNFQYGRDLAFKRAFEKAMGKLIRSMDKFQWNLQNRIDQIRGIRSNLIEEALPLIYRYDSKTENEPQDEPEEKVVHED